MEFLVCVDLEREDTASLLGELESLPHQRPEHELRIAAARAFLVDHAHSVEQGAEYLAAAQGLVERVADPMVRSSFLNRLAYDLAMTARYGEALVVAKRYRADAVGGRLEFVVGHAAYLLAMIHLGLRHFRESALNANRALEAARVLDDAYVEANAHAVRARNLLCQGRAADALIASAHRPDRAASRSVVGELIAAHGLALACTGDRASACSAAAEADALTTGLETKIMTRCVLAICALMSESRDAETLVHEAFDTATQTGAFDPFVVAYRAYPPLLSAVAREESRRGALFGVVRRANDQAIAGKIGLVARDRSAAGGPLTRREQQVYELLREGMTNRQIAQTLVISESTAKVHVRHILEKYGVRSRTEAAVARIDHS
jgi:DNA-binding CsgD family transcriptional regulator